MIRRMGKVLGLLAVVISLSVVVGILRPQRAGATSLWPPKPGGTNIIPDPSGTIPNDNLWALNNDCEKTNPRQSPAFTRWVSLAGAPQATTASVAYGTGSISLEYHTAGVVCWGNSAVTDSFSYVSGSTASPGGTVSGINETARRLIFSPYNQVGRYSHASTVFTYAPSGGFTTSGVYTVTLTEHEAVVFTSGVTGCTSGSGNIPNPFYIRDCTPSYPSFQIYVSVQPQGQAPLGYLDSANCSTINGWAFDWDNVSTKLQIHVYYDGPAGVGTGYAYAPGSGYTVVSRPDVGNAFPGAGNDHGFAIPTPNQYKDGGVHTAYVYIIGINSAGVPNGQNVFIGSKTFGPCYAVSCSVQYPAAVEPGETFSATFTITNNSPVAITPGAGSWRIGANGANRDTDTNNYIASTYYDYARIDWPNSIASGASTLVTVTFQAKVSTTHASNFEHNIANQFALTNTNLSPGVYGFEWQMVLSNSGWYGSKCGGQLQVSNKPYLKVFGNDVKAGAAFVGADETCALNKVYNQKASILAFARNQAVGSSTQWFGAGTQLAAFALGEIEGFSSGITKSPSNSSTTASPPKGLTTGNYYDPSSTYGGRGGQYGCISDYYNIVSGAIGGNAAATNSVNLAGGGDTGQFVAPIATTVTIPGATVAGKKAVVINGDAYISGNIGYGAYSGVANMPSLYVIVRGDIYIDPNVTNLSGVFVAQPRENGTGGNIYTCANNGSFVSAASLTSTCNRQLTINGSFLAQRVAFLRTAGTLNSSAQNETWGSTNIAEIFKSSPELYLSAPSVLQRGTGGQNSSRTYDSITSLPPIL